MKLWLISQNDRDGYDTYDRAVVAATTAEDAAKIHPNGYSSYQPGGESDWPSTYGSWCESADRVTVRYLGESGDGMEPGVICASFNAG